MSEFKIGDRVKIVVPTNDDKRILQDSYFEDWQHSPVGDTGVIERDNGRAGGANWWSVELDKQAETPHGRSVFWTMSFPEHELELISSE